MGQWVQRMLEGGSKGGGYTVGKGVLLSKASFPVMPRSSWHPRVPSQLGHDGASPESCWLVDELSLAVPTQGTKYTLSCNCWLAKDRGDGFTSCVFDLLDATVVNIGVKVQRGPVSVHCTAKGTAGWDGGAVRRWKQGKQGTVTGVLAEVSA